MVVGLLVSNSLSVVRDFGPLPFFPILMIIILVAAIAKAPDYYPLESNG